MLLPPINGVSQIRLNVLPRHDRTCRQVTLLSANSLCIVNQPAIISTLMPPAMFTTGLLQDEIRSPQDRDENPTRRQGDFLTSAHETMNLRRKTGLGRRNTIAVISKWIEKRRSCVWPCHREAFQSFSIIPPSQRLTMRYRTSNGHRPATLTNEFRDSFPVRGKSMGIVTAKTNAGNRNKIDATLRCPSRSSRAQRGYIMPADNIVIMSTSIDALRMCSLAVSFRR